MYTDMAMCDMRDWDVIAQEDLPSLQFLRLSFSAVLMGPMIAAFPSLQKAH